MIAFSPENFKSLKARFPKAIEKEYDVMAIHRNNSERPGENPEHIFDYDDGVRLIISRDKFPGKKSHIHASGSPQKGTEMRKMCEEWREKYGLERAMYLFKVVVEERFLALSGFPDNLIFIGFSEGKGVPHFIVENI